VLPPLILNKLPLEMVKVGFGTLMLYEFGASVAVVAIPDDTTLAFAAAGNAILLLAGPTFNILPLVIPKVCVRDTELPPLILTLLDESAKVGVELMVKFGYVPPTVTLVLGVTIVVGTLILYEFGARVVVTAAPDDTKLVFGAAGKAILLLAGPTFNILPLVIPRVWVSDTELPPLIVNEFDGNTDNVGFGTLMLYEFGASVAVVAIPDDTTLVFAAAGNAILLLAGPTFNILPLVIPRVCVKDTALPPLILTLLDSSAKDGVELMVKFGNDPPIVMFVPGVTIVVGTSMLYVFGAKVVITAAPDDTTDAIAADGRATVFPPLILKLPPWILKVGCGTSML